MMNPHDITKAFEQAIGEYTGAPYVVCVDNCSNALYLALMYNKVQNPKLLSVGIPKCTYPSVPCEIKRAGMEVVFSDNSNFFGVEGKIIGQYPLIFTNILDASLKFTADMYEPKSLQCLSFTGPYKHLKLGKGGAILTDNEHAYKWLKKARFSGRAECSYHEDNFDDNPVLGINAYMPVETAARGLQMMAQFYNRDGSKKVNEDLSLEYPDLSKYQLWK